MIVRRGVVRCKVIIVDHAFFAFQTRAGGQRMRLAQSEDFRAREPVQDDSGDGRLSPTNLWVKGTKKDSRLAFQGLADFLESQLFMAPSLFNGRPSQWTELTTGPTLVGTTQAGIRGDSHIRSGGAVGSSLCSCIILLASSKKASRKFLILSSQISMDISHS